MLFKYTRGKRNLTCACLLALLISTVLIFPSDYPTAEASQNAVPAPLSDNDWDYWSNEPNMVTLSLGGVGIGTSMPTAKLDVVGDIKIFDQIISTAASGTAPLNVASSTRCPNLNADLLDDRHSDRFTRKNYCTLPPGGGIGYVDIPHLHPFRLMVADRNGVTDEICFLHAIKGEQMLFTGFDNWGVHFSGTVSMWNVETLVSLHGGNILLQTPGDGSSRLEFSSVYEGAVCSVIW